MYQHILVINSTYRLNHACTSTHWYVLSHTYFIRGSKKLQSRFEPVIFCILFACMTAALLRYSNHIPDMSTCIFVCLCTLSVCSCQFTWLLMTDRRRLSRCARLRPCRSLGPGPPGPGWASHDSPSESQHCYRPWRVICLGSWRLRDRDPAWNSPWLETWRWPVWLSEPECSGYRRLGRNLQVPLSAGFKWCQPTSLSGSFQNAGKETRGPLAVTSH